MPVDYHAWTHRPKALGGTDPIGQPTFAKVRRVSAIEITATILSVEFTFEEMWTNDPTNFTMNASGFPEVIKSGLYVVTWWHRMYLDTGAATSVQTNSAYHYTTSPGPTYVGTTNFVNTRTGRQPNPPAYELVGANLSLAGQMSENVENITETNSVYFTMPTTIVDPGYAQYGNAAMIITRLCDSGSKVYP